MGPKVSGQRAKNVKQDLTDAQLGFIENQNHCALCNSVLNIQVESYLEDYYLREEAECPKCHVKTRVKNHKIQ